MYRQAHTPVNKPSLDDLKSQFTDPLTREKMDSYPTELAHMLSIGLSNEKIKAACVHL